MSNQKQDETKIDFNKIKEGEGFQDHLLESKAGHDLEFRIIGDHIYCVTDNINRIIIAFDAGNGHGTVMNVVDYNLPINEEEA